MTNDSKATGFEIALCVHCSVRITYARATGWTEPECDGDSGGVCQFSPDGHEPDNPRFAHLKRGA